MRLERGGPRSDGRELNPLRARKVKSFVIGTLRRRKRGEGDEKGIGL